MTLSEIYADINLRYFSGELHPIDRIQFSFVEDLSQGNFIDTRGDVAAIAIIDGDTYTWRKTITPTDNLRIEVNRAFEGFTKFLYLIIAHECLHIKLPGDRHGSKAWNSEVRRLQGLGLFLRAF